LFLFADFLQHLTELLVELSQLLLIADGVGQNRGELFSLFEGEACQDQQPDLQMIFIGGGWLVCLGSYGGSLRDPRS
jgi:hypothetical protein